jgi:hypothetical protein
VVRSLFDCRHKRLSRAAEIDLGQPEPGSDGNEILACLSAEKLPVNPVEYALKT